MLCIYEELRSVAHAVADSSEGFQGCCGELDYLECAAGDSKGADGIHGHREVRALGGSTRMMMKVCGIS